MSLSKKVIITCSKCGKPVEFVTWYSLNTDLSPNVPEKIISGEFFKTICPHCGEILEVEYPVLYHDLKHNVLIKVMSKSSSLQDEVTAFNSALTGMNLIFENYTKRLVRSSGQLREKVAIIEAGLDDRVIEILKLFSIIEVQDTNPDFEIESCFFEIRNGEKTISLYNNKEECIVTKYTEEGYTIAEEQLSLLYKGKSMQDIEIIDQNWALKITEKLYNKIEADSPEMLSDESDIVNESSNRDDEDYKIQKRICNICGSRIDPQTKKCNGGIRHFLKEIKVNKLLKIAVILSVVMLISVLINTVLIVKLNEFNEDNEYYRSEVVSQRGQISELKKENRDKGEELTFYKKAVAIVMNDGSKKYHVYGCKDLKKTVPVWVVYYKEAEDRGYYECSKCH